MDKNVGGTDRVVRIAAGIVLFVVGLAGLAGLVELPVVVAGIFLLVGLVVTGTGLAQRCLLYRAVGVNTCAAPNR